MERSWWWKTGLFTVVTLLSCLYLVPTIVPESQQPAFFKKHLQKRIQLGLDLQGGLHLVYEVAVSKAVSDKADRTATDIEDKLRKDKKVRDFTIEREGEKDIVLRFKNPAEMAKLDRQFFVEYRN